MTPLAIALGLVGLAAVLAAWNVARLALANRAKVRDWSELAGRIDAHAGILDEHVGRIIDAEGALAKLRDDVDDHAAEIRKLKLAKMGGRG